MYYLNCNSIRYLRILELEGVFELIPAAIVSAYSPLETWINAMYIVSFSTVCDLGVIICTL